VSDPAEKEWKFVGKRSVRFVAQAIPGQGWRIWDRAGRRPRGLITKDFPSAELDRMNALSKEKRKKARAKNLLLKKGRESGGNTV
jgi:hypothetical protein